MIIVKADNSYLKVLYNVFFFLACFKLSIRTLTSLFVEQIKLTAQKSRQKHSTKHLLRASHSPGHRPPLPPGISGRRAGLPW